MASPVRVRLPAAAAIRWPRWCACCLLALDEPGPPGPDGLAVPWCEDCRRHAGMHRVERWTRRGRWACWALFFLLLAVGSSPLLRGVRRWFVLGAAGTFLFLGLGLSAALRLRLEERKESCAAAGPPVRRLAAAKAGVELECDNADFALLLAEENPGASLPSS